MVSLEDNLVAGQGSELKTHVGVLPQNNDEDKPWHKKHQRKNK